VFIFGWIQKRTKKITAVKETPDPASAALKFFKLVRFTHSNSEEFSGAWLPLGPDGVSFKAERVFLSFTRDDSHKKLHPALDLAKSQSNGATDRCRDGLHECLHGSVLSSEIL
jgi:hypothetical protein